MELKINREYMMRHLGVAALMAGLCCWFAYDGAVASPQKDESYFVELHHADPARGAELKKSAIERQFQFALLAALASLVIAGGVLRVKRQTLQWDDAQMCGSLTGGKPIAFSDVMETDNSKWEKKGILVLKSKDGRSVTLDTWHHSGARELAAKFGVKDAEPEQETGESAAS